MLTHSFSPREGEPHATVAACTAAHGSSTRALTSSLPMCNLGCIVHNTDLLDLPTAYCIKLLSKHTMQEDASSQPRSLKKLLCILDKTAYSLAKRV